MSADLQRIGWLRSAVLVCACAFVAFGAWSATGASVGASHDADVTVRAVQARPAPAAAAPAPHARVKHHDTAPLAATAPARARTHVCTGAGGHHYRVDVQIKCLKITTPSGKLLDRARQHKTIKTPAKPSAPATAAPGAATPRPTSGTGAPTTPTPSSKVTPTGGTTAP
jgi:hypothetical protein